jgi:hypothetical protein
MQRTLLTPDNAGRIVDLAKRYFWWNSANESGHTLPRMIAQIMRLGSYDDILNLEGIAAPDVLGDVMRNSAAGWFDDRSWDFWRGRLSHSGVRDIPEQRPKRTFANARTL